mmetsp:Transcript_9256/g.21504  ORF Transcript_9256/g.21504 Transcript_9256/m.21504 type:complete len:338 (-) Transcript_9256:362-1375(-)
MTGRWGVSTRHLRGTPMPSPPFVGRATLGRRTTIRSPCGPTWWPCCEACGTRASYMAAGFSSRAGCPTSAEAAAGLPKRSTRSGRDAALTHQPPPLHIPLHDPNPTFLRMARARWSARSDCFRCKWCYLPRQPRPTLEPLNESVVGPFPFATGALQIFSSSLAAQVFGSSLVSTLVAAARKAAANRHTLWWRRWDCSLEDVNVGYAVHEAANNLSVAYVDLTGLVVDASLAWVQKSDATLLQMLRSLVTVHKLEPNEAVLAANELFEEEESARYIKLNVTPVNHKRMHAKINRRLRPLLEALPNTTVRESPVHLKGCEPFPRLRSLSAWRLCEWRSR